MKVNLPVAFALSFVVSAASAWAADERGNPTSSPTAENISLEEFQAHCANPLQFPAQVPPSNITLHCRSLETQFVPEAPGVVATGVTRHIQAQISSNKWAVGNNQHAEGLPAAPKPETCPRFKEVETALAHDINLTCDDVIGIKGPLEEYCAAATDRERNSNPQQITKRDTGRVIDTCSGLPLLQNDAAAGRAGIWGKERDHGQLGTIGKAGERGQPGAADRDGDHGQPAAADRDGDRGQPAAADRAEDRGQPGAPGNGGGDRGPHGAAAGKDGERGLLGGLGKGLGGK